MSDRLTLANAIEDAGIERAKAERNLIHDNVATKADIAAVNARIDLVERRLMARLGGLTVVGFGLLFAALHIWPPHG